MGKKRQLSSKAHSLSHKQQVAEVIKPTDTSGNTVPQTKTFHYRERKTKASSREASNKPLTPRGSASSCLYVRRKVGTERGRRASFLTCLSTRTPSTSVKLILTQSKALCSTHTSLTDRTTVRPVSPHLNDTDTCENYGIGPNGMAAVRNKVYYRADTCRVRAQKPYL